MCSPSSNEMVEKIIVAIFVLLLGQLANAAGLCPVTLIRGAGSLDSLSITLILIPQP